MCMFMTELSTSTCGATTVEPLPGSLASVYPAAEQSCDEAAVKMLVSCGKISREIVCNMAVEQFVVCTVECMKPRSQAPYKFRMGPGNEARVHADHSTHAT